MSYSILPLILLSVSASLFAAPERQRFAVYFGGSGADTANSISIDADGNAYVAGQTTSISGKKTAFVSKTNADGSQVLWTSYLSGDSATGIAIDGRGALWVAGKGFLAKLNLENGRAERTLETESLRALAIDAAGGVYVAGDGFVSKYDGFEKVYSVKIDGSVCGLAVDRAGAAVVAYGRALSRLLPDGSGVDYTVDLGWAANAVAVDAAGAAFVTGANARVAKVMPSGIAFVVELAGVLEQEGSALAFDAAGNLFVAGWTNSSDFARSRGWHGDRDGFLVKLSAAGEILESAFAGTATRDGLQALAVTPDGDVYAAGWTEGAGLGSGPLAQSHGGMDALLLKFSGSGNREITGTTTVLTASPAGSSVLSQAVTLTATVSPVGGTGKVTFYDGASVIGVRTLSGATATLTTSLLASGTRSLRAYYAGDVNFSASTSPGLAYTITVTPSLTYAPLSGSTTATGTGPTSLAVADFNGDGRADVAVVNLAVNSVSILLSNGAGGFTPAGSAIPVGNNPNGIVAGDFNGDGRADLAIAGSNANNVTILLGNGAGGFASSSVSAGSGPYGLTAADFNGDGATDLAVPSFASSNVLILLGNGAGGFTPAAGTPPATGAQPAVAAAGDFNGDGFVDLAVGNFTSSTVTILLGNGTGAFTPASGSPIAVGAGPFSIAIADLNADGRLDVATANYAGGTISVLLGNGTGGFTAASGSPVAAGSGPRTIVALDYNGDGRLDLAVTNSVSNTISIFQGNGSGGFTVAIGSPIPAGETPFGLAVGDFNADGRADFAVVTGGANSVKTILGVGNAPLVVSGAPVSSTSPTQAFTFTTRDADGAANMQRIYFLVNTSPSVPANTCHGFYDVPANSIFLYDDSTSILSAPLVPGAAGTIQNSQCAISGAASAVSASGTDRILTLGLTRQGSYTNGSLNIYIYAVDQQANGSGFTPAATWSSAIAPAPPTLAASSPSTATATTQTFSLTARDANGSLNIQRIYFLVNTSTAIPAGTCHGFYERTSNGIFLYNDTLSALSGPITPGVGGTIQNSQCSIDAAASSVSAAGTDVVLGLNITRQGTYNTGSLNLYVWVTDFEATGTGWIQASTWNSLSTPQAPSLAAATPGTSSAATQTFTLTARDANGYTDIQRVYFLVNTSTAIPNNTCHGYYDRVSNGIYLYNDALAVLLGPIAPGVSGTVANSQCSISGAASSVSAAGTDVVLGLNITRQGPYATGSLNLYAWVTDFAGTGSGWTLASTWTSSSTPAAPTLALATPGTTSSASQTFSLTARDSNGFSDIQRVYFLVNTSTAIPANTCHGYYDRPSNAIVLYNDATTAPAGSVTPGVAGTVQNSQCAISGAASSVSASGTDIVLGLNITRQGTYSTGTLNLYAWVVDNAQSGTGWVQASTWTSAVSPQPPTLAAATPSASASAAQTFSVTGRDANGFTDIQRLYFLVNTSTAVPAGSCHGFYDRASNAIFLYNDALTALVGAVTPGVAGTIQNGQCSINGAASSVSASGTDVVLNLNITRQGSYATGAKNLYIYVTDTANTGSGWTLASAWNL